jgi:hypothetical protein
MYFNYGRKLRLVNSVLSSLPIFAMSTLKIYQWVLDECDKYRRHCLWRNKYLDSKTPPLASWDLVCRPKDQGGLEVLKLSVQNDCLLMKHLHKFYNKDTIPSISLAWEAYYQSVLPPLRARDLFGGEIVLNLWILTRTWLHAHYKMVGPSYFGRTHGGKRYWHRNGNSYLHMSRMPPIQSEMLSILPILLSYFIEAMVEYNALVDLVQTTHLSLDKDNWIVTVNGIGYKVSSACMSLTKHDPVIPAIKWL